jgi:predicted NBD/HSP70 family sugar kinase
VGFGYGGGVDRARNLPLECFHEQGWPDLDPVKLLADAFQAPVFMENDCKAAALAEAVIGAGKGARTVFYITLGTGVGGGLVRDERIVALSDHGEAEIGHLLVEAGGPRCPCGRRGCLEALASGPGLANLAREAGLELDGRGLMDAWRRGEPTASAVVGRAAEALGVALGAVMTMFAPQAIVIGGGVGGGNPDYLALAADHAKPYCSTYFHSFFRVAPASLGEAVVTQGAALLAARGAVVSL